MAKNTTKAEMFPNWYIYWEKKRIRENFRFSSIFSHILPKIWQKMQKAWVLLPYASKLIFDLVDFKKSFGQNFTHIDFSVVKYIRLIDGKSEDG